MVCLPALGLCALRCGRVRALRTGLPPRGPGSGHELLPGGWLLLLLLLVAWPALSLRAWDVDRFTAAAQRLGPGAVASARALHGAMGRAAGQDEEARARAMNSFFNQHLDYVDDGEAWGAVDHWASPLESLARGQGDCEDFAIGKYFSLVALGVPMQKLRLVYVRVQLPGAAMATPHMVLAYYPSPGADPLILDNLVEEVRPASKRPDLQPVFSFNAEGLWQGSRGERAGDPAARLSRWRDVLAKAAAEGF